MSVRPTQTILKKKKKVLLVGWDSADWKIIQPLIDQGGMNGIRALADGGIASNLATLEPQLSPMLWTSIATGKMADHHGIHGFTEVDQISGTIMPVSAASRQCKTIWEILGERGMKSHIVGWFATQGETGDHVTSVSNLYPHISGVTSDQTPADWTPPTPGTYWPESLAAELDHLRVSPHELGPEVLQAFIPSGGRIDQTRDNRVGILAQHLAESYSIHAAATHLMEQDPEWDFMAVYYRAIDEISHHFMPYHPPRMEGMPEEDFEIYQHVVNATYRAHDMMLQRLLQLAGPDTMVLLVSDHGFHSDHLRPTYTPGIPAGITVWHRPQGVLLAKGPGIAPGAPVYGPRLLDITPTILNYLDLPVGQDMEGRVLSEIFAEPKTISTLPSWEKTGIPRSEPRSLSNQDIGELLEQFVALGYIDKIASDEDAAATSVRLENKWNLARACFYAGRDEVALPLFEDCFAQIPERTDFAQALARVQLKLGLIEEADETLAICLEFFGESINARLLRAVIELEKKNYRAALDELDEIRGASPDHPELLQIACVAQVALEQFHDAFATSEHLLSIDPTNVHALLTISRCRIASGNFRDAADIALRALTLNFDLPRGHFLLARAHLGLDEWEEAKQALKTCLHLAPSHRAAIAMLIKLHKRLGEQEAARELEVRAISFQFENHARKEQRLAALRESAIERATKRRADREKIRKAASKMIDRSESPPASFTIVSGLPRSGTSLMMQMLASAGLSVMTDSERKADEDNPQGYWEWEGIKSLRSDPRLIEEAEGKIVKVISALLPALPSQHRYRIIFMRRPLPEVIASQSRMLQNSGGSPPLDTSPFQRTLTIHLDQTLSTLREMENVDLLEIDYPTLIREPSAQLSRITDFIDMPFPDQLGDPIRPELHRNRAPETR